MIEMTSSIRASFKDQEDAYRVKKRTMDMLPEADKHMAELQKLIEMSAQRLVTLSQQWEEHRTPLVAQYRELKSLTDLRNVSLDFTCMFLSVHNIRLLVLISIL